MLLQPYGTALRSSQIAKEVFECPVDLTQTRQSWTKSVEPCEIPLAWEKRRWRHEHWKRVVAGWHVPRYSGKNTHWAGMRTRKSSAADLRNSPLARTMWRSFAQRVSPCERGGSSASRQGINNANHARAYLSLERTSVSTNEYMRSSLRRARNASIFALSKCDSCVAHFVAMKGTNIYREQHESASWCKQGANCTSHERTVS